MSKQTRHRRGQPLGKRARAAAVLRRASSPVPARFESLEARTLFSTFTVNSTADGGAGTLRQAIFDANAQPGADQIVFSFTGGGVHTIAPTSALPAITDTLDIDGTTQSGYSGTPLVALDGQFNLGNGLVIAAPNSRIAGLQIGGFLGNGVTIAAGGDGSSVVASYVGTDGTNSVWNNNGIVVNAANVTIGGLAAGAGNVISGNQGDGVQFGGASNGAVAGNLIGVDASGAHVLGNSNGVNVQNSTAVAITGNVISANFGNGVNVVASTGVTIAGNKIGTDAGGTMSVDGFNSFGNSGNGISFGVDAFGNTVGGATAADRNVIANNNGDGVRFNTGGGGALTGTNLVQGNYIGTDVTGSLALPNGNGVTVVSGSVGVTVESNVIAGNWGEGVWLEDAALVQNNLIGVAADGSSPQPNWGDGVSVFSSGATAGSTITGNVIAFNYSNGVGVYGGTRNAIRGNSIHDNGYLGIDLGGDGVTPNDALGHVGPNNYANFPVITNVDNAAGAVTLSGSLDSTPSTSFVLEFFSSSAADPSGYGPGQTLLGSTVVTTDASGHATFTVQFSNVSVGQTVVAATATDVDGNTSEFSFAQAIPAPRSLAGSVT
ncbi:MAG TPA: hypothetical protein VLI90_17435, partial [Tepidisphaeraceae bacterium]|nr:hypothetical protein [Tepidisphaeraceae bacterium]